MIVNIVALIIAIHSVESKVSNFCLQATLPMHNSRYLMCLSYFYSDWSTPNIQAVLLVRRCRNCIWSPKRGCHGPACSNVVFGNLG